MRNWIRYADERIGNLIVFNWVHSLAKVAAKVMIGRTLAEQGLTEDLDVSGVFVKSPVFPFVRFPGVDTLLGPEMKSTGEVMGGADSFGNAYAKAMIAAGHPLPSEGTAIETERWPVPVHASRM